MTIIQYKQPDPEYIDLRILFRQIVERKWFILAIGFSICGLAVIYSLLRPASYQATALLKIQHRQHSITTNDINNPLDESISTQIALIRSDYILKPVIHRLGLDIDVTPLKKISLNRFFHKNRNQVSVSVLELPIKYINKTLTLIADADNHYRLYNHKGKILIEGTVGTRVSNNNCVIKIDKMDAPYHSQFHIIKYPESAIIKQLRSRLSVVDLSNTSENAANKTAILQLSLVGSKPSEIIRTLNEIAMTTQKTNMVIKSNEAKTTLHFLNQQLPIIQSSLKEAEEKLNQYRSTSGRVDIKLQTEYLLTHISDIDKQLEKIRLEQINMMQQYTSYHPFVISLNQERIELEKQRSELTNQLKKLPASDQEASDLTRDVTVKNNLYTLLLNQIHQYQVMQAGILSDIEILSLASTPSLSMPLKLSIIAFFSLLLGLILGCIGLIAWQIFNRRINDPHWSERVWNIKNLAIIPYSHNQNINFNAFKKDQHPSLPVLTYHSPNDIAIESLCGLRTFLQLRLANVENRLISIMGLSKNTGKTFISVNLASLLARMGDKVLLIDGDIRTGHTHQYFSTQGTPGFTDVLCGSHSIEEALIQCTNDHHLSFLPAGTKVHKIADLLMSSDCKMLLSILSSKFQYVLINTAPNIFITDNIAIGSSAGTNLLVLRANQHDILDVNRTISTLSHAGIQLHGCIFNHIRTTKTTRYQYFLNSLSNLAVKK